MVRGAFGLVEADQGPRPALPRLLQDAVFRTTALVKIGLRSPSARLGPAVRSAKSPRASAAVRFPSATRRPACADRSAPAVPRLRSGAKAGRVARGETPFAARGA